MEKLKPLSVAVDKVRPLLFGESYESRMILDHVITGRDNVIQINHGTVKAGYALGGGVHEDDEIYYILSGKGKLQLDDEIIDVFPNQVIFIPAGVYHALDNRESSEDMTILTFWRDWRMNEAYTERLNQWGKSFMTVDEAEEK
ncbi:MAG: cupin domain-containing protein [Clostridia bacterium]|nr:cupin domain-containing protein [Clostridia bacterium]